MERTVEQILADVAGGTVQPLYLVAGDRVLAEPQAQRIAGALAARAGCRVERYRRPAELAPILADLKTHALFASAKVALVVDSAVVADARAAADLIDQAEEGLPVDDAAAELRPAQRRAASRLLQALRVFGLEPTRGTPSRLLAELPDAALAGGRRLRKKKPRGRSPRQRQALREQLEGLLAAAQASDLVGFAEGDLAELGAILDGGLPPGH
ncbi:MAG: hypothetical protein D6696_18535, partial [Acidobacteria bacterium]